MKGPKPDSSASPVPESLVELLNEQREMEQALVSLVQNTSGHSGQAFFCALVSSLAGVFKTRYAFVAELDPGRPGRVRTLAVWAAGQPADNFEYDLAGTPCETVVAGDVCFYPDGAAAQFPNDLMLQQMGVVSYCGTPMFDAANRVVGLAAILDDRPMPAKHHRSAPILQILVARAATELNRLRAEHALGASERLHHSLLECLPQCVFRKDPQGRFTYVNRQFARLVGKDPAAILGRTDYDLYPPELAAKYQADDQRVLQSRLVQEITEENQAPSGARMVVNVVKIPVFDDAGEVAGIQGIFWDVTDRRLAMERLRASEQRLALHFEQTPLAVIEWDLSFRVVRWNPAAERIFGWTAAAATGQHAPFIIPEESRSHVGAVWEGLLQKRGGFRSTNANLTREGRQILCDWYNTPLVDPDGKVIGVASLVQDVTERFKAEAALKESEDRYRRIVETSNEGICAIDAGSNIVFVNRRLGQMLGYLPEELVGKPLLTLLLPEDSKDHAVRMEERRQGQAGQFQRRYLHRSGEPRWMHVSAAPIFDDQGRFAGSFASFTDITEQKRGEDERARLATAIEQAAEAIMITDAHGVIQYVNPAFERITGFSRAEALGETPRMLKSGRHEVLFYQDMWNTLLRGDTWTGRFANRRKDGRIYEVEETISPIRDHAGHIVSFVTLQRDITDQIKMEQQLRQAQKMEAIGQLAGGVAHDFNNLLQVISGNTELAKQDLPAGHIAAESLEEVAKAATRAAEVVRQLLVFSRRETIRAEVLNLNDLINGLMKMVRRLIGEHIELEVVSCPQLRSILADPGQMEQILVNLCVNARDAMPAGGRIRIETANADLDAAFCEKQSWARPGSFVVLSVQDTGIGIVPEIRDRIFEPFFTTKEVGKGTGLGLATIYGIVKQHRGLIALESELGHGTRFLVYLPVHDGSGVKRSPGAASLESTTARGETLLLAEDEEYVRLLAERVLTRAGYEVLVASNGNEAIRLFEENAQRISAAVLDVVMPGRSGKAVAEFIWSQRPGLPILFATGYGRAHLGASFEPQPNVELIYKPYLPDDLLRRIRQVLKK